VIVVGWQGHNQPKISGVGPNSDGRAWDGCVFSVPLFAGTWASLRPVLWKGGKRYRQDVNGI